MLIAVVIFLAVIFFGAILGGALWLSLRLRRAAQTEEKGKEKTPGEGLPFRWHYVLLPLVFLFLSAVLAALIYPQLPAEVASHFKFDGTPSQWLSRGTVVVWVLALQLFFALLAIGGTWGITRMGALFRAADVSLKPERVLLFMGNAIALPQLIVLFAMVDIFSYNSYQWHIMPMWLLLLIILGLATIALAVLLALFLLRVKQGTTPPDQIKERSD